MTQYVQAKIETMERPMTAWIFLSAGFLLLCAYAYFINGTIANIVATKQMQGEITEIASRVGGLESEYLAAKSQINMEYAQAIGMKESAGNIVYVAKKPLASLSFNK